MLYKNVIERMLAYGAAVWCLDPPVRIKKKLNTIPACSDSSIQNYSNLGAPGDTWNSSSLPPAPAGGQHFGTEHLPSELFEISRSWRG
ncbi:hypothetical protein AVEN_146208-1 [Araneus ventricosus]|uniref:Uncharacterized protein n=1 Tax=Araneus ventricosus TaxID=182803 RepID=A0A4Y2CIS1_ARAVE|nr:hypothetical protein AVEN_146208-1 [Araneus ventricosus]